MNHLANKKPLTKFTTGKLFITENFLCLKKINYRCTKPLLLFTFTI